MLSQEALEAADRLDEAQVWVRHPDYAEHFSRDDLFDWVEKRPTGVFDRAAALLRRLAAALPTAGQDDRERARKIVQPFRTWRGRDFIVRGNAEPIIAAITAALAEVRAEERDRQATAIRERSA